MRHRITLKHLRAFTAVAETGSFTLAAARLCVTQSALTAVIQQFEDAASIKMFDRTTRKVMLAPHAAGFLPEAQRLVRQFDSSIADLLALAQGHAGHIRIAAAASVIRHFLAGSVEAFRLQFPNVTIALRDAAAPDVERLVVEGEVDFGIESRYQGFEGLDYVPLLTDRYGVVCRRDSPLATDTGSLRWDQLPTRGYVGFSTDTGIGQFLRRDASHWAPIGATHDQVTSTTSLFAVLSMGPRFSVIPALALRPHEYPDLVFRPLIEPVLSRQLCLITRHLRSLSPGAQRLLDSLSQHLEKASLPAGVERVMQGAADSSATKSRGFAPPHAPTSCTSAVSE